MMRRPNRRFWIEAGLGTAGAILFLATLLVPAWIEAVFRVDPDGGSGALEWLIAAAFAATAVVLALGARHELRRQWPSRRRADAVTGGTETARAPIGRGPT
jgi:hypothetical protein